jgi:hypothetical protein
VIESNKSPTSAFGEWAEAKCTFFHSAHASGVGLYPESDQIDSSRTNPAGLVHEFEKKGTAGNKRQTASGRLTFIMGIFDSLLQDVRFALRTLAARPPFHGHRGALAGARDRSQHRNL